MTERRIAGFVVPLDFYDGPEVKSIPKRVRAAAIGVWTLAGNYAATKLTDGHVDAETLKTLGCTDTIRHALQDTANVRGEHSPLWIDAHDGGIQFTNWGKWQRTNGEVSAYREAEAERKRKARAAKLLRKSDGNTAYQSNSQATRGENADINNREANEPEPATTSTDTRMSRRTSGGNPPGVRHDRDRDRDRDVSTYVSKSPPVSNTRDVEPFDPHGAASATPGADIVMRLVPDELSSATKCGLRLQASALINDGANPTDVKAAVELWLTKTGVGPGVLPSLHADVIKTRNGASRNGTAPTTSTTDDKGSRWITGTAQLDTHTQTALEAR